MSATEAAPSEGSAPPGRIFVKTFSVRTVIDDILL